MCRPKIYVYIVDHAMRDNWLGLFEEIQLNAKGGPATLFAWYMGEQALVDQSISELRGLDEVGLDEIPTE